MLERALVEIVARKVDANSEDHRPFGQRAFHPSADGGRKWRRIRNGGGEVSVSDAAQLAEAIGLDLPSLIWQATQLLASGFAPEIQAKRSQKSGGKDKEAAAA